MPKPEFGVIYSRLHEVVSPASFARTVEALGYDSVWVTEGLVNQLAALDPILAMAELARAGSRLRVGSCIIVSPLRNPAILAKEIATLDFLSGGRITLGIAVGGSALSNPADYRVSGIDLRERGARCDEGISVMKKLWTGERVSHHGNFFNFDNIYMHPKPVQLPHPPLWIGGNAEGSIRRAARFGDGFVPVGEGGAAYRRQCERLMQHCAHAARDFATITPAVHLYYCMAATRAEARALVERTLVARYGISVSIEDDGRFLLGNADDCAIVIEDYLGAGVAHFVVNTVRPLGEVEDDIARFAAEVMPRFR